MSKQKFPKTINRLIKDIETNFSTTYKDCFCQKKTYKDGEALIQLMELANLQTKSLGMVVMFINSDRDIPGATQSFRENNQVTCFDLYGFI